MANVYVFALLMACVMSSQAIRWKDCGSKLSTVKSVMVTDCENSDTCDLPQGSNVTFTVDFITNAPAADAKSVVHGVIAGVALPFPIGQPDACKDRSCGLNCPLKSSKSYSFHPAIEVLSSYPKLRVVVKWELKDPNGDDIFCVEVPAQIVAAKAKRSNHTPKLMQLLK